MKTVEAIFENGILRPLMPLVLDEGTILRVELPEETGRSEAHSYDHAKAMAALKEIIDMPLENDEPISGEDHDEILYGWKRSK